MFRLLVILFIVSAVNCINDMELDLSAFRNIPPETLTCFLDSSSIMVSGGKLTGELVVEENADRLLVMVNEEDADGAGMQPVITRLPTDPCPDPSKSEETYKTILNGFKECPLKKGQSSSVEETTLENLEDEFDVMEGQALKIRVDILSLNEGQDITAEFTSLMSAAKNLCQFEFDGVAKKK